MESMTAWLTDQARVRTRRGIVRQAAAAAHPAGAEPLDLASNDYLGLAGDARLQNAAIEAIRRYGAGASASRVVTGTKQVHEELEDQLARLTGQPAGLAFSSGYTANLGLLTALGGPGTLIIRDEHVHASLIDAARLSRSVVEVFPHSDLGAVELLLATRSQPRAVVVVESIYSILGDAADLPALAELCAWHDAVLIVDEAHGIGVAGAGRGAVHAAGLNGADHVVVTATLSKSLGSQGGAVLGSPLLREHLVNTARTFIFDTGLAPAAAAAAARACEIIIDDPELAGRMNQVAGLISGGCGIPQSAGAVQSVPVESPQRAAAVAAELRGAGILVGCFRPPSVPDGISRLRLTARAGLDPQRVTEACRLVTKLLGQAP